MITVSNAKKHAKAHKKKTVCFKMDITNEEKRQISLLSKWEGLSAKTVIMKLVRQALQQLPETALSAKELTRLSPQERHLIMLQQFEEAESLYREQPDMLVPDVDSPISY